MSRLGKSDPDAALAAILLTLLVAVRTDSDKRVLKRRKGLSQVTVGGYNAAQRSGGCRISRQLATVNPQSGGRRRYSAHCLMQSGTPAQ